MSDPAQTSASTSVTWADPARHQAFDRWLGGIAAAQGLRPETLRPASADASFRRYLRVDDERGGSASWAQAAPADSSAATARAVGRRACRRPCTEV